MLILCHPLIQARIRDVVENLLHLFKAAWTVIVSCYLNMLHDAGTRVKLLSFPFVYSCWLAYGRTSQFML